MKVIDDTIKAIEYNMSGDSSKVLAKALASACNTRYEVSLLEASSSLDPANRELLLKLATIRQQPDYSNEAQFKAMNWLRENEFIE